ncbi:hypothetical protein [Paludisphaera soli]|uniref:hypothetical protein n=1 Tax=Paludisphaera soli TaxID=2712865 RepID=UPI0013EAAEE6|nr:hypothetical protein [Paludisphaera soli]
MNDAVPGGRKPTSVGGMLLILAAAALLFAALRSGDDVTTVWAVIGGCTGLVALLRYRDVLAWRASRGLETGRGRKFREALAAVGVASLVVGLSDLAFLVGFFGTVSPFGISWRAFVGPSGGRCYVGEPADVGWQATKGLILATLVAGSLRRATWLPGATDWRRRGSYLKLWPVVVASAIGLIRLVTQVLVITAIRPGVRTDSTAFGPGKRKGPTSPPSPSHPEPRP